MVKINKLKNNCIKIHTKIFFKCLISQIIPIVSYISSIITIVVLKFRQNDNWIFNFKDPFSYILLALCIVLLLLGVFSIIKEIKISKNATVNKNELHNLLALARYSATCSVINFAGDLSWLKDDYNSIKEIKNLHPNVSFTVYYDIRFISEDTLPLLNKLLKENVIKAIPYRNGSEIKSRCMLIDMEGDIDNKAIGKIYSYNRTPKDSNKFYWRSFSSLDYEFFNSIESILSTIKNQKTLNFKIGISGVNNVGKTTLANICQ